VSAVRVAIPVYKGKRRFHLDKGRPWSVVEHMMLAALARRGAQSAATLAADSALSHRLVLEVLIRLMRAGWVQVSQGKEGLLFSVTTQGASLVGREELPNSPKRITRWMTFVIDRITGTLYRSRELPFLEPHVVQERAETERLVWMEPRLISAIDDPAVVVETLLEDDERLVAVETSGDRFVDRYALASVRDGRVEGLPARAPVELRRLVIEAAATASANPAGEGSPRFLPATPPLVSEQVMQKPVDAVFRVEDLILGGDEHRLLLESAIATARHHLILHSTFISEDRFNEVRPRLMEAVHRGVVVDVFWGEDEDKTDSRSTRQVVARLREQVAREGFDQSLRIHPFSTRSHAKLIIADAGSTDSLYAVVGSCNWLASAFGSFEASVRLRDPRVVALVIDLVATLARGGSGHWTERVAELARMAEDTRRRPTPEDDQAKVALVLGPQHAHYVRLARDTATSRMFVTSHRLGYATGPAVVVPAIASARDRSLRIEVFFGRPSGLTKRDVQEIQTSAAVEGIQIAPILEPRLHAKLLAWDDDFLVVTSQNWLSADPGEANIRREVGVFVGMTDVARIVVDRFLAARAEFAAADGGHM
jgi:cardiolipin synthase A/B